MTQFRLAARVTVSAYTTVEAETLEEAIEASKRRPVEFAGGPYLRQECWLVEDIDGLPKDIEADEG